MSSQIVKLLAVSCIHGSEEPRVEEFSALYSYGVLSQMARFGEIQYKDMATLNERLSIDPGLAYDEALQKLQQFCHSTRTHYAFTGTMTATAREAASYEVKIVFRLYEAQGNRYIVDEVQHLRFSEAEFPLADFNRLVNLTVDHFGRAIFGETFPVGNAPVSHSLKALQFFLKAHQATGNAEKIALYEAAVAEDPQMEASYCHLARIYRNENEYEKSVFNYRKTLENSHGSLRNRTIYATEAGIACALLGKPDIALQWWQKAIEYDPSYINPYFNIANTLEDRDDFAQAERYFLKAQELAPDDFRTFFNLARIYSKLGAWDKALSQYRFQLQTEDGDPWCHSDVATCYLNLGDINNARHHLEKILALDPEGEAGQYAQLILSGLG